MTVNIETIQRLTRDLRRAADTLSSNEARFLVEAYYIIQEDRKRADNQRRSLDQREQLHPVLDWFAAQNRVIEQQVKGVLQRYADNHHMGRWAQRIIGVGPIISAGLLSHIDIRKAPTVGHIWRFAGLDPGQQWLGSSKTKDLVREQLGKRKKPTTADIVALCERLNRNPDTVIRDATQNKRSGRVRALTVERLVSALARRPWNGELKTLCWKMGESFVKVSGNPQSLYGRLYIERKRQEEKRNQAGEYAEQAAQSLRDKSFGSETTARAFYEAGQLPPAQIHARAKRFAIKIFLSHWHHRAYEHHHGVVPAPPYVIQQLGHADLIEPPL